MHDIKIGSVIKQPERGDVYYADLTGIEQSIGCEQTGKRPVLIIQNDIGNRYSPVTIVAVITSKVKKNMGTHVIFDNKKILPQKSVICMEQIKTIDKTRLEDYRGNVGNKVMESVDKAIALSIGINNLYMRPKTENFKGRSINMDIVPKETELDCVEHNWIKVTENQLEFFTNIQQYVANLKYEKEQLDKQIEDVLDFIESTSYNVAQGYKVYKILRDLRIKRKEKLKEITILEALIEGFDCEEMRRKYQSSLAKMKNIMQEMEGPKIIHELADIAV